MNLYRKMRSHGYRPWRRKRTETRRRDANASLTLETISHESIPRQSVTLGMRSPDEDTSRWAVVNLQFFFVQWLLVSQHKDSKRHLIRFIVKLARGAMRRMERTARMDEMAYVASACRDSRPWKRWSWRSWWARRTWSLKIRKDPTSTQNSALAWWRGEYRKNFFVSSPEFMISFSEYSSSTQVYIQGVQWEGVKVNKLVFCN